MLSIDLSDVAYEVRHLPRTIRRYWYLRGRWRIDGARLRYDASSAIPLAVLKILREYREDCQSPYFIAVHDIDMEKLEPLIAKGERIARDEYDDEYPTDSEAWAAWLHDVADVLPWFWD